MKKFKWLAIILFIILVLYFVAGYFLPNLPVASKLWGTNMSKDLGVELSADNAIAGLIALEHPTSTADLEAIINNPEDYKHFKGALTNNQASSLISTIDFPIKLVQIKFGPDGAMESSGIINTNQLQDLLSDFGASNDVVNSVMGIISNMDWITYYVSGELSIKNNQVSLDVDQLEFGRISVPQSLKDQMENNMGSLEGFISNLLTSQGYYIRDMSISEGSVNLDMDRPLGSLEPWLNYIE